VGRHVVREFCRDGWEVVALVRSDTAALPPHDFLHVVARDLSRSGALANVLREGDVVVHLAGRAHVMREHATDPLAAFRAANVAPTELLCVSAARAGVAQLVFVSSAKVFGEGREQPYTLADPLAPADAYAQSKAEAERVVHDAAAGGAFRGTVLRPPFVYGPGGKGNFPRLISLARLSTRMPLPLASIDNRRSILFVGNLADLIRRVALQSTWSTRVLLPTDAVDVSTPELLRAIAAATGSRARLHRFPPAALRAAARLIGRAADMARLTESLRLDSRHLRTDLGWDPPYDIHRALALSVHTAGDRVATAYA
jgi:UDP-glucose 4-epimerase